MLPLLRRLSIVVGATGIGAAWLAFQGPLPLIRFTTVLEQPVPWWYSISAFPILGMLLADLLALVMSVGLTLPTLELGTQILLILILSNLRLGIQIPISGHVLLFSYFLLRRLVIAVPENPIRHIEWLTALVLFLVAAYAKVAWWDDPLTLLFGVAAGAALALLSWSVARVHQARSSS